MLFFNIYMQTHFSLLKFAKVISPLGKICLYLDLENHIQSRVILDVILETHWLSTRLHFMRTVCHMISQYKTMQILLLPPKKMLKFF